MKKVVVASPSQFDETINSLINDAKANVGENKLFVLVTGEKMAETGKSWCPDCVVAEPVIEKMLGSLANVTLVECPVVRSEYRGNPEYAYRKHAQLQIKAVPTLIRWTAKGPKPKLVEEQILDETLMQEMIDM